MHALLHICMLCHTYCVLDVCLVIYITNRMCALPYVTNHLCSLPYVSQNMHALSHICILCHTYCILDVCLVVYITNHMCALPYISQNICVPCHIRFFYIADHMSALSYLSHSCVLCHTYDVFGVCLVRYIMNRIYTRVPCHISQNIHVPLSHICHVSFICVCLSA